MSPRQPCVGPTGRGKLAFQHRSDAREAARNLGKQFDGKKKVIYHCPDCRQYHLATRKSR